MVKLSLGNSITKITGLSRSELAKLRKKFSFLDVQATRFSRYPVYRYAIDRYGNFGTGLVSDIKSLYPDISIEDNRIKPPPKNNKIRLRKNLPFEPYPEQKQIVDHLVSKSRGLGILCTGVGKSICQVLAINSIRQPTLVLVPNLNLKESMYQELKYYFGTQLVNKYVKNKPNKLITVANIDSLPLDQTDVFSDKYFLCLDEMHHVAAKTYVQANENLFQSMYYRLGLTATNFRNNEEENIFLRAFTSKVLLQISEE